MTIQQIEFCEAWADLWIASRDGVESLTQRDRLARARWDISADDQALIVLRLTRTAETV
jgi:hypothetical protein